MDTLADAARDLLWAIDGGYFTDAFLPNSAFVAAVRDAYERETGRSPWPRRDDAEAARIPSRKNAA